MTTYINYSFLSDMFLTLKFTSLKRQQAEQHLQLRVSFKICQNKVKKFTVGFLLSGFKLL